MFENMNGLTVEIINPPTDEPTSLVCTIFIVTIKHPVLMISLRVIIVMILFIEL